jgi:hypothetical protein
MLEENVEGRAACALPVPLSPLADGRSLDRPNPLKGRIDMKRSFLVLIATLALVLGLSGSALAAANPVASCSGIVGSSFAGQPGGEASDRGDGRDEAANEGIPPGALFSDFSRHHLGDVDACHAGT